MSIKTTELYTIFKDIRNIYGLDFKNISTFRIFRSLLQMIYINLYAVNKQSSIKIDENSPFSDGNSTTTKNQLGM